MAIQMHALIMIDKGLDKGVIRTINTSDRKQRGFGKGFFGFRKMFWDYLTKLNVAFYDACCEDAGTEGMYPMRYNSNLGRVEYFNGTAWTDVPNDGLPTTTTTSTTTTTTAP